MRILIIEDKPKHILSAEKFAKECGKEVVIVKSYDEAEKALCGEDRFGRGEPVKNFEVVLTDMMLPASLTGIGNYDKKKAVEGTEQPYGLSLMMLAMRTGVKAVGLLTDGGHHDHPLTWALDTLRGYGDGEHFTIGDVTVLCASDGPRFTQKYRKDEEDKPRHVPAGDPLEGAKDWMEFWLMLMSACGPQKQL
jgi:CheY-like chemotaxis protein